VALELEEGHARVPLPIRVKDLRLVARKVSLASSSKQGAHQPRGNKAKPPPHPVVTTERCGSGTIRCGGGRTTSGEMLSGRR
jgi:hypothetical protein